MLAAMPAWAVFQLARTVWSPAVIAFAMLVPSVFGFVMIADDKNRARRGLHRTPEKVLNLVELLGGWPGSYLAQQRFRHKTIKPSYRKKFWAIVLLHQVVAGAVIFGSLPLKP
ncbi:MAG: DUF1294 domain-containing protein [Acidobacteriota bacterium]